MFVSRPSPVSIALTTKAHGIDWSKGRFFTHGLLACRPLRFRSPKYSPKRSTAADAEKGIRLANIKAKKDNRDAKASPVEAAEVSNFDPAEPRSIQKANAWGMTA